MVDENIVYILVVVSTALLSFISFIISWIKNPDLFSPVKVFVIFNVFFYLDIYINSYNYYVVITYFIQCLLLLVLAFVEKPLSCQEVVIKKDINIKVIIVIWVVSIISIVNQIAIIVELGGVLNYIGNIAYRVEYFKGKGYVIVLNNLISIMNVLYFSYLLRSKNINKKHWLIFIAHFVVFVGIAMFSGSRSFLLMTILVEVIIYHYMFKRLTVIKMAPFVVFIIFMVALLGGLRNSVTISEGTVSVSGGSVKMESRHFKYGLIPLEIIYEASISELSYGMTYASLFTNFIPRKIYPDKLDTGGIVFTKVYTGDQWGGLSNLATGAITEGIINYGLPLGFVIGFLTLLVFLLLGIKIYSKLPEMLTKRNNYAYVVLYIYMLLAFSRYSYSEFTYTFYTYVLYYLVPVMFVIIMSRFTLLKAHKVN
ncbi:MAG: oligosaccharide repeat unit polymerase [Colwelliaceae bacterium]|nr:oligosaccharide repeat unit polymerase [Colwelliaceae bacterium]